MEKEKSKKDSLLGLPSLIALVVGSLIGSGVFSLISGMAAEASLMGVVFGWLVTGIGILFLVLSFMNLNKKRPDLKAGIYSYAKEGFGKYIGFNSSWGYWISAWIGNVAYATLLFAAIGYFMSTFGDGMNWQSVLGASVITWGIFVLISRGIKSSAVTNTIITIAKIIPLIISIVIIASAFKLNIFQSDIWGSEADLGSLFAQMKSTMLTTVWVFIGIEGAVIFSGRARKTKDVAKASLIGFFIVLAIYVLTTVLAFGIMKQQDLAGLADPATATLIESIVGKWGAILINVGVIISISGGLLAWTMFAAELPYQAAKNGDFPKMFAKTNKHDAPVNALLVTTILVQLFLLTLLKSDKAYMGLYSLATSTILIPYAFTAFYQLKHSLQEKNGTKGRIGNILIGLVASVYSIWLVYAAGIEYLLLTTIIYAPAGLIYILMQKKQKKEIKTWEYSIILIMLALAAYAIYQLIIGKIAL